MTNKPKNSAACRWRSGHAGAVKENTAGAETITDNPWGYNVINKNNIALYKEIEKKYTSLNTRIKINSKIMSFIGYINNTVIKLPIYFNLHMHIDEQIINIIPK